MAKPIFEVNYFKWSIFDSVTGTIPTIRGGINLKNTQKWLSAFTIASNNSYQFSKTLNWIYSVVLYVKSLKKDNSYIISSQPTNYLVHSSTASSSSLTIASLNYIWTTANLLGRVNQQIWQARIYQGLLTQDEITNIRSSSKRWYWL